MDNPKGDGFRLFMSDELNEIKTQTIDFKTYQGWYFMFIVTKFPYSNTYSSARTN